MLRLALCTFVLIAASTSAQEDNLGAQVAERRAALVEAKKKGQDTPDLGLAAYQLGKSLLDQGQVVDAEGLLDQSLKIHEKLGNPNSLNLTLTRAQLARLYRATGREEKAKALEAKVKDAL